MPAILTCILLLMVLSFSAPIVLHEAAAEQRPADTIYQLDKMIVSSSKKNRSSSVNEHPLDEFTAEDIITTAGTAEDISRFIATLPSTVSSLGDKFDNSLYVRGGRPSEVLFVVDGIEMENINHFSKATGSGGPVGFINSEFVNKISFFAGNEPARFPGRLSSVVEVNMKSGSFTGRHSELGCKLTGGMFATEGPVGDAASYLVSGRYIDFGALNLYPTEQGIPRLGDCLVKGTCLLGKTDEVSLTGLFSYNDFSHHYPMWESDDVKGGLYSNTCEEKQRIIQGGAGITYKVIRGSFKHQLTLSASFRNGRTADSLYDYTNLFFTRRYTANPFLEDADARYRSTFTSNTTVAVGENWRFTCGARANTQYCSMLTNNTRLYSGAYTYCINGSAYEGERFEYPRARSACITTYEAGGFGDITFSSGAWVASLGLRADNFSVLHATTLSPRLSMELPFVCKSSMHMSFSVKHQLPVEMPSLLFYSLSWLQEKSDEEAKRTLYALMEQVKPLRCYQAAGEIEKKVNGWVCMKSGIFGKLYDREYHFVSPRQQEVFYLDQKSEFVLFPQDGRRMAYGIEGTIENSRKKWLLYTGAASLFTVKNRYRDGNWYDDWTNVRYTLLLMLSTAVLKGQQFSVTCQINGGRPYCREMIVADCLGRKSTRYAPGSDFYSEQMDKMIMINVRYGIERHFNTFNTEFFIDVLNVLNAQPTIEYQFNGETFQPVKPFGITPVAGVKVQW